MALGNESIEKLAQRIAGGQRRLKEYDEYSRSSVDFLNRYPDYQSFINNTEKGRVLSEKINQLIEVGNKASRDVFRLLVATEEFLEVQRQLNVSGGSGSRLERTTEPMREDNLSWNKQVERPVFKEETVNTKITWDNNGNRPGDSFETKSEFGNI